MAFRRVDIAGAVGGREFQPRALAPRLEKGRGRHTSDADPDASAHAPPEADTHASASADAHADSAPDAHAHADLAAAVDVAAAPRLAAARPGLAAVASPSPVVSGERGTRVSGPR